MMPSTPFFPFRYHAQAFETSPSIPCFSSLPFPSSYLSFAFFLPTFLAEKSLPNRWRLGMFSPPPLNQPISDFSETPLHFFHPPPEGSLRVLPPSFRFILCPLETIFRRTGLSRAIFFSFSNYPSLTHKMVFAFVRLAGVRQRMGFV